MTRVDPARVADVPGRIPVYDAVADTPLDQLVLPEPTYLEAPSSKQVGERWQTIQAEFVDDPRRSVAEAHALVGELMQRIVDSFTRERDTLEHQWQTGQQVSTEDLRLCLQRYRAFFSRLVPVAATGGR